MLFLDLGDNSSQNSLSSSGPMVQGRRIADMRLRNGRLIRGGENTPQTVLPQPLTPPGMGQRREVAAEGQRQLLGFVDGHRRCSNPTPWNGHYPARGWLQAGIRQLLGWALSQAAAPEGTALLEDLRPAPCWGKIPFPRVCVWKQPYLPWGLEGFGAWRSSPVVVRAGERQLSFR